LRDNFLNHKTNSL